MTKNKNRIDAIAEHSIAQELGLEAGDYLLSIDDTPVLDVFDFRMRTTVPRLRIEIEKKTGERIEFDIEKDEYDELGVDFENPLMDREKGCQNQCVFCFVDQLPSGLRKSLYFKDDDLRLSFLTGNYVTLTNLEDVELDRLIAYHLSPMNISVHTTNPSLRREMMKNKHAGDILDRLRKITQAGIWVNVQIVLCPGINDGQELDRTLLDLSGLGDGLKSIALVPVGLTRHREENRVAPLRPYDRAGAAKIVGLVGKWQDILLEQRGERILYASDEFYIKAGIPFPPTTEYEDFPQLENGVGMMALFIRTMQEGITKRLLKMKRRQDPNALRIIPDDGQVVLITGVDAKPYLESFLPDLSLLYGSKFHVRAIPNRFFGETVTVAGLVTGGDIIAELVGNPEARIQYDKAVIPSCMLRSGEQVFLDDRSVAEVEKAAGLEIICSEPTGEGLLLTLDEYFPGIFKKKK